MTTQQLIVQGRNRGAYAIRVKLKEKLIATILVNPKTFEPHGWECPASRWALDLYNSTFTPGISFTTGKILESVKSSVELLLPSATIEFHIEGKWI